MRDAGWIKRADGKEVWRGELWQGRVLIDGKRRVVYGGREGEALEKLLALRTGAARGFLPAPHRLTVAGLLE